MKNKLVSCNELLLQKKTAQYLERYNHLMSSDVLGDMQHLLSPFFILSDILFRSTVDMHVFPRYSNDLRERLLPLLKQRVNNHVLKDEYHISKMIYLLTYLVGKLDDYYRPFNIHSLSSALDTRIYIHNALDGIRLTNTIGIAAQVHYDEVNRFDNQVFSDLCQEIKLLVRNSPDLAKELLFDTEVLLDLFQIDAFRTFFKIEYSHDARKWEYWLKLMVG